GEQLKAAIALLASKSPRGQDLPRYSDRDRVRAGDVEYARREADRADIDLLAGLLPLGLSGRDDLADVRVRRGSDNNFRSLKAFDVICVKGDVLHRLDDYCIAWTPSRNIDTRFGGGQEVYAVYTRRLPPRPDDELKPVAEHGHR